MLFLRNTIYQKPYQLDNTQHQKREKQNDLQITVSYHERPPYYITGVNNELSGLVGATALMAFQNSGLEFTTQKMPPHRQLKSIINNTERICAVGWFKTAKRESFAHFTLPLYQDKPTSVLTRIRTGLPDKLFNINKLLSSGTYTLLVKRGYSYGEYIDEAIQQHDVNIVKTSGNTSQMMGMLVSGKADYFFISTEEAESAIAAIETPNDYSIITLRDMPKGNMRHLMCSKQVSEEEISRLNSAINTIIRSAKSSYQNQ